MIDPLDNVIREANRLIAVLQQMDQVRGNSSKLDYLAADLARTRRNYKTLIEASGPDPRTARARRDAAANGGIGRTGPTTPANPQPR